LWQLPGQAPREFAGQHFDFPAVALSAAGRTLATVEDVGNRVLLWDVDSSGSLEKNGLYLLGEFTSMPGAVAFSPDGRLVAVANRTQGIRLWTVATGELFCPLRSPGSAGETLALAFTPDGRTIVSGEAGGAIRLWEVATGMQRRTLTGHGMAIQGLAVSGDGRLLASASADKSVLLHKLPGR
jgi:WD40 repeat protein